MTASDQELRISNNISQKEVNSCKLLDYVSLFVERLYERFYEILCFVKRYIVINNSRLPTLHRQRTKLPSISEKKFDCVWIHTDFCLAIFC